MPKHKKSKEQDDKEFDDMLAEFRTADVSTGSNIYIYIYGNASPCIKLVIERGD
jgi:hypothetical protein